jgi:hypothetical protein
MQETSYLVKYSLAMMEDTTKPTYFFFQTVNHRSPEGKSKVQVQKFLVTKLQYAMEQLIT